MNKPKAILFDFDGVLAKTMEDNFIAWKNAFKNVGINISKEDYMPLEGASLNKIAKTISEKYNISIKIDNITSEKENYFKKNHSFSFYPGVLESIYILKLKEIKIAIVTSAHKERLFSTTPPSFLEKFDAIITGDNFEMGKPSPDPYLTALKTLNLNPLECIVVENSPLGIKSAKSAGIFCVAICSTLDKSYLNESDIVIESFKDLKKIDVLKTYF